MECIVVDDNKNNLYICNDIIEDEIGASAKTFTDPILALEYIKENIVDLIILDWQMPIIDGPEFIKRLKALSLAQIPKVLMCTCRDDSEDILEILSSGIEIEGYVIKPFDRETLAIKLREAQGVKAA
jgi:two-component system chemotaxis response regulator CheY